MAIFKVEIIETTSKIVEVEAYDEIEAISVVEQRFEQMLDLLPCIHREFAPYDD